jgi:hypothetical protein
VGGDKIGIPPACLRDQAVADAKVLAGLRLCAWVKGFP